MTYQYMFLMIFLFVAVAFIFSYVGYEKGRSIKDREIERMVGEALDESDLQDTIEKNNTRIIHIEQSMDIVNRLLLLTDEQKKEIKERLEKELV